jgi:hypothetical protein
MPQNNETNKHSQEIDFFEKVRINGDQDNWGHGIRQEIIGKQGIVFGITRQLSEMKYYVYIHDLDKTYGIAGANLKSLNQYEAVDNLIPEFSSHFLFLFIYYMGYRGMAENPKYFPEFERKITSIENEHPPKAIELCLEHALNNIEKVNNPLIFQNNYSDELIRKYLHQYQDSFLRKARNSRR